jgi:hypothetical protein
MKAYWGSGGIALCILDLGTRWRWVVSFTSRPLNSQGKSPWNPLDRRLGEPQSRSGRGGEKKNSQPLPGLERPIIQRVAQRYTTQLSRLLCYIILLYCENIINSKWKVCFLKIHKWLIGWLGQYFTYFIGILVQINEVVFAKYNSTQKLPSTILCHQRPYWAERLGIGFLVSFDFSPLRYHILNYKIEP